MKPICDRLSWQLSGSPKIVRTHPDRESRPERERLAKVRSFDAFKNSENAENAAMLPMDTRLAGGGRREAHEAAAQQESSNTGPRLFRIRPVRSRRGGLSSNLSCTLPSLACRSPVSQNASMKAGHHNKPAKTVCKISTTRACS